MVAAPPAERLDQLRQVDDATGEVVDLPDDLAEPAQVDGLSDVSAGWCVIIGRVRHGLADERPEDYLEQVARSRPGQLSKALVLDQMQVCTGTTVVDLGCGSGVDLAAFADRAGASGHVLGIDHDAAALTRASAAVAARPEVRILRADVHRLPLADGSVDRVHTDRVLQHVADPRSALAEALRVLRPGGLAVFAEPDWDTLVVNHADHTTVSAYRRFVAERVVRNPRVSRQLSTWCRHLGLDPRVILCTAVFADTPTADSVLGLGRVAARAGAAGWLTAGQLRAWAHDLETGTLSASLSLVVTVIQLD